MVGWFPPGPLMALNGRSAKFSPRECGVSRKDGSRGCQARAEAILLRRRGAPAPWQVPVGGDGLMPSGSAFFLVVLLIGAAAILIPMAVWSLECIAALLPARKREWLADARRPPVTVLVPAHNESSIIRLTLADLARQLLPGDRVVVIADNCSDSTANIARQAGVDVLERHAPLHKGKSYALDHAVRSLREDRPKFSWLSMRTAQHIRARWIPWRAWPSSPASRSRRITRWSCPRTHPRCSLWRH